MLLLAGSIEENANGEPGQSDIICGCLTGNLFPFTGEQQT